MQAFWVVMGSFSSFALAILSAAILSRYLDKTEYGTYRQILYVYNTLLIVFTAGLPRVFSYFLPRFNIAQGKDIVIKITKSLFLAGLIFSISLFLFSELIASLLQNPELAIGLKYFSPIPMLLLPTMGIEGIFSSYKKTIYIAIYNTLTRLLMLLFIVLPVILLKGSYLYAIYGWSIASFITLLLAYHFKNIPFKGIKTKKANLTYVEIFTYSFPLVAASLAGIAIRAADQFYISRFFGTEVFAEFSNGFIALPFVAMITGATSTVLTPLFSKLMHDKSDVIHIATLWRSALLKSAMLIYPMISFFIFHANHIILFLYSATYENSIIYFQIAMTLSFFDIIIFAPLLLAMGETKFYSKLHIVFALLSWTITYLAIILFNSPIAIAITSVLLRITLISVCMRYVSMLLTIKLLELIPVKKITILLLHSLSIAYLLDTLILHFFPYLSHIISLGLNFIGFATTLLLTAKLFDINYLSTLQPIINKFMDRKIQN